MKRPFKIFPSVGYKNSQYQIVAKVDNLTIDFYHEDILIKSVAVNSDYPTVLNSLTPTGRITAKCDFNGEVFEQELEIKEVLRLGSSEFKKAFLFDYTNYSFFLMKDRLLLYDEKKKVLLTENHYSPTEILNLNKSKYLFVTKIGEKSEGIVNLGVYDTETFSMEGELLNSYQEIEIIPDMNKAWLLNKDTKTIHCFELTKFTSNSFTELKKYDDFKGFFTDRIANKIFIDYEDKIKISDLSNLHQSIEVLKTSFNAIDKFGNTYTLDGDKLIYKPCFGGPSTFIKLDFEFNLRSEKFYHIGQGLQSENDLTDLNNSAENLKSIITPSIPSGQIKHYYPLPEPESESTFSHSLYPTQGGIYLIKKYTEREFKGVTCKWNGNKWELIPHAIERNKYSMFFCSSIKNEILFNDVSVFEIVESLYPILLLNMDYEVHLFSGRNSLKIQNESTIKLISINGYSYCLISKKERTTLFNIKSEIKMELEGIDILNYDFIDTHQIIWYIMKTQYASDSLQGFDLKTCTKIQLDFKKIQHSVFNDPKFIQFFENYALSSNQMVFNPKNLNVKGAFIGEFEEFSKGLNKVFSYREGSAYLSIYNPYYKNFNLAEIPIEVHSYKESYMSPNGKILVLKNNSDKYEWYDIEKDETVNFLSGKFLDFKEDGNLIVEDNVTRAVKIIDPSTFQDITPLNYHYFHFLSPDGKLYADINTKVKFFNRLNGRELSKEDVIKYDKELNGPRSTMNEREREQIKHQLDYNKRMIFQEFSNELGKLGIEDYSKISYFTVVRHVKYTQIGIVGTDVTLDIEFPEYLIFYNYSAFSYDNKYFGYVGKPSSNGLIHLFKIDFDEENKKLSIIDSYLSRYPKWASWVCGFSKTGYFATYDSAPDTYILNMDDELFEDKTTDSVLRQNFNNSKSNIYSTFRKWHEIKGKNFLCFSPSGKYLALSEQGYEPLTLGGYGHQESSVVHIAKTKSGEILQSFRDHGFQLVNPKIKDTIFVSFSEDEKRLMTMSKDGVVIIRDINLEPDISFEISKSESKQFVKTSKGI